MKAIQLRNTDGIDALTHEDIPRPVPETNELLVSVHAAGVNPLDWLIARGMLSHLRSNQTPWTLGWDVSGVIESVGDEVSAFDPGDTVCGMTRLPDAGGTFADYVTVTPDEVTPKPSSHSHREMAGVPMAGQTAFHTLYEAGSLDPGDRVLVHAAAGGVGHIAVQLASNTGAHVIGTASAANESFVRDLGADEFVDYRTQRFENVVDDVDFVLDPVGGEVLDRSVQVTRRGGTVVTLPEPPTDKVVDQYLDREGVDVRFFDVVLDSDPMALQKVAAHVDTGVITPSVAETYPLSDVQQALTRSADGHVSGKLVVAPRMG